MSNANNDFFLRFSLVFQVFFSFLCFSIPSASWPAEIFLRTTIFHFNLEVFNMFYFLCYLPKAQGST